MELDIMSALGVTTQKIKEYVDNFFNSLPSIEDAELISVNDIDGICQQELEILEDAGGMKF